MKKVALLDVCDTLLPFNSTYKFVEFLYPHKAFPQRYLLFKIVNKIIYKLTGVDLIRCYNLRLLRNFTRAELIAKADIFLKNIQFNKAIIEKLSFFKNDNYHIYILSATIDTIAESLASKLNIDGYYSSKLKFSENGKSLGTLQLDLIAEKNKVIKLINKNCSYSVFLTDNKSDVNCIPYCNEFIAVIPRNKKENISFWQTKNITSMIIL